MKRHKQGTQEGSQAGVERLSSSKADLAKKQEAGGRGAGKAWAENVAEYGQLKRVAAFYKNSEPGASWNAAYDAGGLLYVQMTDDEHPEHDEVGEFWNRWAKTREPSEEFVFSFAAGASDVLKSI